jgi:hypothetical protein
METECLVITPNEGTAPLEVSLTSGGSAGEYKFSFGDRGEPIVGGPRATHIYAKPGYYVASVNLGDRECKRLVSVFAKGNVAGVSQSTNRELIGQVFTSVDFSLWFGLFLLVFSLFALSRYELARIVDKEKLNK